MADAAVARQMTYARARLWLGIASVGSLVAIATGLLVLAAPERIVGTPVVVAVCAIAIYVIVTAPFDYFGGYWLPRKYGRSRESFVDFSRRWVRGVVVHAGLLALAGAVLIVVGQSLGTVAAIMVAGVMQVLVVANQFRLARLAGLNAGRMHLGDEPTDYYIARVEDRGFTGGLVGLPGRAVNVFPEHWLRELPAPQFNIQLARRATAAGTGSRARGVIVAFVFNFVGFAVCAHMPGAAVVDVSGLIALSLWFTLWSFLGLLVLPTVSRRGVYEVDQAVPRGGASAEALARSIRALDRWQDDEPRRSAGVESIFHPIPAAEHRIARLTDQAPIRGAQHAARMALPMSIVGLGLLARAVHCNCGRPELWFMLPGD